MNNDLTLMRGSATLKSSLKEIAKKEGRTLEWVINDAFKQYISNYGATAPVLAHKTVHDVVQANAERKVWTEEDEKAVTPNFKKQPLPKPIKKSFPDVKYTNPEKTA